ncbi:MAG TPA: choice-of-anchor tandem repeat GloVer-containing protein [Bryobacteraceae bacterium]|nr:choice-of-anchor tandem repeat GloVer-containing protein [Bryobacteraceae bacterium]
MKHLLTIFAVAALLAGGAGAAGKTQLIYSFAGDTDGEYADTDLAIDGAGNIFGTTVQGGQFSSGTVFQLAPSAGGWIHTVLYSFTGGVDGGEPYKGVTLDAHGNLYGTAGVGGLYTGPCVDTGCGVVFKLTNSGGTWTPQVIHSFTGGTDGYGPGARVTVDSHGNVYGTTPTGGVDGFGIVYQLKPDGNGGYTEKVVHTFTGGMDGAGGSAGRLIVDNSGNIIGVCTTGGANGAGVIFELRPTATGEWNVTALYAFKGEPDSGFPYGEIVGDGRGNLYGTTYYAGAHDFGAIYRLSRQNGVWTETWLYSFQGGTDGNGPISTLVADAAGNLYGTTSAGGAACNCGTIFKIDPAGSIPAYSVVYRFKGAPGGGFVYNGMTADATGRLLYGATVHGGPTDDGTIYQFTP